MRGADLRYARERRGVAREQFAEMTGTTARDVEEWECAGGVVPRRHRSAVDGALWRLECEDALKRAGLPECDWLAALDQRQEEVDPEEFVAHFGSCATCKARDEYVRSHVRPMPIGGSIPARVLGVLDRLSGWHRSAFGGAMMLLVMGGIGVPILLFQGIFRRDPVQVASAFGLLFLLVTSGAAGGLVYHVTAPLRDRGTVGYYTASILTVYGYLLVAFGLLSLAARVFGNELIGDDIDIFSDRVGQESLLVVGAFFGIVFGRGMRRAYPSARAEASKRPVEVAKRRWLSVRTVVLALALLAGIGGRLLQRSFEPAQPRDWAAELPALRAEAEAAPDDPHAQRDLGTALSALGQWEEAEAALASAMRHDPDDPDLLNDLGWAHVQQRELEDAASLFRRAIELDAEHPRAHHNLAWTLYWLGRHGEAEASYATALALAEHPDRVRGDRGWNLIAMGRLVDAEAEFREAVRIRPDNTWYYRGLAVTLMQSGRPQEALESYREAVQLAPDNGELRGEVGRLLHLMGNHSEAVREFEEADRLDPSYFRDRPDERGMWEASRAGRPYAPATP